MPATQRSSKQIITRSILQACVLLACCSMTFALNPALDVSQYAHTAWKIREGFTKGAITSIAQTPDGYLWLGTEFGFVRFDGSERPLAAATGSASPLQRDYPACSPHAMALFGSAPERAG